MKSRHIILAIAAVASLVGCGTVADQLGAPLAQESDLEALDQLNGARVGDPALVVAAHDGLSFFNAHLLGSLPLEATLRVEEAIAVAVIAATDWAPSPAPATVEQPAATVVAGL